MNSKKLLGNVPTDLLYQALETEKGGVQIYTAALRCALNKDLREEWNKYLEQTKTHVQICTDLIQQLGLDPNTETPGRQVVRYLGTSLVKTIELALRCADPQAAQIVAAECVTLAETKDHLNWELIGELAKKSELSEASMLQPAYAQVEEEDARCARGRGARRRTGCAVEACPAGRASRACLGRARACTSTSQGRTSRAP